MGAVANRVSVGTSATQLVAGDRDGLRVIVRNKSAGSVFVGGSDVTAAEGFELAEGESLSVFIDSGDDLYGRTASGTSSVDTLVTGSG